MALDPNKMVLRFEIEIVKNQTIYLTDEEYEDYINNDNNENQQESGE